MPRLLFICWLILAACAMRAGEFPDSWIWDDTPEARAPHAALEGKPMPALKLTGWLNGKVTPDAMKGKVVLLDFYATWCPTCLTDIPHNNALYEKYKDKGLVMIGVCTSAHGLEDMAEMVRVKKMKYPTALIPNSPPPRRGPRKAFPPTPSLTAKASSASSHSDPIASKKSFKNCSRNRRRRET